MENSSLNFEKEYTQKFFDNLINDIFKILPIYEYCIMDADTQLEEYVKHIDRLICCLIGCDYFLDNCKFLEIACTLRGMQHNSTLTHRKVKSLVFGTITEIEKLREEYGNELL